MTLGDRVKYVRDNLVASHNGSRSLRAKGLTQDEFARAIGAKDRHAVIPWEANAREPRDYFERIAALTPYPAEAFLRNGDQAGVSLVTIDLRLRRLEAKVDEAAGKSADSLLALERMIARGIARIERRLPLADDPAQRGGGG